MRVKPAGRIVCCLSFLFALLAASRVRAGGFLLYEHNASVTGMAGASASTAEDPSAVYFNPAVISRLEGLQLQLGVTGILPYISYEAAGESDRTYLTCTPEGHCGLEPVNDGEHSTDAKLKGFNPIHLYATYNLSDWGIAIGYGLNNPFGLGTYWPGEWDGRFISNEIEIQTFFNNPVVAVDLARLLGLRETLELSLAAGYTFVYGTAHLAKRLDLRAAELLSRGEIQDSWGEMVMDGSATSHGWNLALHAAWPGQLAFGLSVRGGFAERGAIRMPFEGEARFSFNPAGAKARSLLDSQITFPDTTRGKVTIDLPLHMNMGLAWTGVESLTVAVDFYVAFFQSYDELALRFLCSQQGSCPGLADAAAPIDKRWHESWQLSIGAEYVLFDCLPLRLGYGTVSSPMPAETLDPSLPDGQRQLVAFGTGYRGSWWRFDIGYMLALWEARKDNQVGVGDELNPEGAANGTYTTRSHILAGSFTARL
ncbi:MAG: outer membrane protein transport protein [Deltaproteobacteria bacterium]|nr:outer membrane protein transport protein [Deltaproteobacteria bacterium]